jgi:hypothetical protein
MAVFKPKTRMISFRLSEDEYECLRQTSQSRGARSVSDYARVTLCRVVAGNPGAAESPDTRIEQINQKMGELDHEVQRLAKVVEGLGNHADADDATLEAQPAFR